MNAEYHMATAEKFLKQVTTQTSEAAWVDGQADQAWVANNLAAAQAHATLAQARLQMIANQRAV